jgi:hypothetical protein
MIVIYATMKHMPRVVDPFSERYTVRILNLRREAPKIQLAALRGVVHPSHNVLKHAALRGGGHPAAPSGTRHLAQLTKAPQTLVQPDLPPNLVIPQETPVPLAILWATKNNPTQAITPPPTQQATSANVEPSLDTPNQELKLADVQISATAFMTEMPMPVPASSTPIKVRRPDAPELVPQTVSQPIAPPTPARVMSLSDLLLQKGAVPLPQVNETTPAPPSDALAAEHPGLPPQNGTGETPSRQNGTGESDTPGNQGTETAAAGGVGDNGTSNDLNVTRVELPKDGHFGVVVVGSSPTEEYPEASGVWTDRLAYTVYLHVGLAKSWIMQYCLPPDADAAAAGETTRPDAPWPYVVVRPHLAPGDTDGNAILVHGLINGRGQFEQLSVVFPQQFAQSQFVLSALQQWQFRPATQNGQVTTVEVLLIIPRES